MNTIHIAFASDRNYSRPLAVTIASILANAGADDSLHFHIIDQGLSGECRERIEALREIRHFTVAYLALSPEQQEEARSGPMEGAMARFGDSGAVFARAFLPALLPELPQVLYLDCDLLVLGSLKPLWATHFDGKYAVCVRDALEYLRDAQKDIAAFITSLGIRESGVYFNSGVMLMNLEKARKRKMAQRFFMLRQQFSTVIRTADQDTFNILFQGDAVILGQEWNFQDPMSKWTPEFTFANPRFSPKIIHYTTSDKPWKEGNTCVHGELYARYARMAGWDLP